ncbi:MAG: alpha-amylase family glycosyl hydrolase [Ignavibacteriales bacterium]|nr:alpha-amylase family glycosyl hydrolase [Ignavibacteriales bacterium]
MRRIFKLLIRLQLFQLFFGGVLLAQSFNVTKIEPPNWWTGMKNNKIQLMVYGENLENISADFGSADLKVTKVNKAENSNYTFIDVEILEDASPAIYKLVLKNDKEKQEFDFPILQRKNSSDSFQGFSPKDVIYLIMPDRFSDGDTTNNYIKEMVDGYKPNSGIGRHGGDIKGIINHLDYIKELGFTALWVTPLVENNTGISYHGYAPTDHYNIDKRFGTNELYKNLVEEAHKKGLKIILDHINNHIGITHPWMKNLPFKDWINGSVDDHHNTPHYNQSLFDVNSDKYVWDYSNTGWFVREMPDLNQRNPFLAKYLIQNTIWWIESTGLDGVREDTYPYSDQKFLSEWAQTILEEYPTLNIVGEVWIGDPAFRAPFQKGSYFPKEFDSNLPSVTDFGLQEAIKDVFANGKSIKLIYELLAKDVLYANPNNLVTFLDNHDIERLIFSAKGDVKNFKLALTLLLTTRGIPQILYGTEIGLMGGPDHGSLRADFPGGFPKDKHTAFTKEGRSEKENEIYNFCKQLLAIRKTHQALTDGKLVHYPPRDEVYFYFKILGDEQIMVVINNNIKPKEFELSFIKYRLDDKKTLINLFSGKEIKLDDSPKIIIPEKTAAIFEIK